MMKNVFILAKLKSSVNTLNVVSGFPVRRSVTTERSPAMAELVKKRAQILETMNPRMRIRDISFLQYKCWLVTYVALIIDENCLKI